MNTQPRRIPQGESQYPRVIAPSSQRFDLPSGAAENLTQLQFPMHNFPTTQSHVHSPGMHHQPNPPLTGHHGGPAGQQGASQPPIQQAHSQNQPPQAHSASSQGQQQQQQFQRLKVEDALSYLDQVKLQFGNQPQVYNDFLDIMKEFKSQTIDTPGVINRVSNLFKGHPDLIVGFNTFLPPGYKIEVQANEISVHQPGQQTLCIPTNAPVMLPSATPMPGQKMDMFTMQPKTTPPPAHMSSTPTHGSSHHSYHQSPHRGGGGGAEPMGATTPSHQPQPQQPQAGQPVEFNHAINYVNKIKNRFQGQPEIYKAFLEILHTYQKEQRNLKDGIVSPSCKPLTEAEVYSQVAKLFQNQEDLLAEFGQFLPDANGSSYGGYLNMLQTDSSALGVRNDHSSTVKKPSLGNKSQLGKSGNQHRRPSGGPQPPQKKQRTGTLKDISLAEAGRYGTLNEFAFFDKVRKFLKHPEVYENFLRCLVLFNQEVISRTELVQLVQTFLQRSPELYKWFKDFLGYKESGGTTEAVPQGALGKERVSGELAMEIDYATCKRYGASYRALPKSYPQPKCSGRSPLCREVLNDTWVSFPSWSEDSTFVTSRKTQYEEHIYRCEDERFELDVVIETNLATIRCLEAVQKKMGRMSSEEAAKFRLDNALGGSSDVLQRKAIQRIYGDKAPDIIDGLKKNPVVAVPLVLRRLKAKEEEWREAQRNFNKIWREQNEKYYLKSLDHQGINFKQNDIKAIRSKALLNEIETIYDERSEQDSESVEAFNPHLSYVYKDRSVIEDAASLILHHMKRQAGIHKDDKHKIKLLLRQLIPDLFFTPRQEMSDDEDDDDMETDEIDKETTKSEEKKESEKDRSSNSGKNGKDSETGTPKIKEEKMETMEIKQEDEESKSGDSAINGSLDENTNDDGDLEDDDVYSLFFVNNNWYLFFRLHQILCERLYKIYTYSVKIAAEEAQCRKDRKESTAIALRLKAPSEIEPEEYYPYFLEMVKSLLDGNLESTQYEDQLREMYGIHAYIAFTMEKLVQNLVRQMQHIVQDEVCLKITGLHQEERKNGATGGRVATVHQRSAKEGAYQKRAEQCLSEENCFRVVIFKKECKLTFELMDTDHEPSDDPIEVERWSEYVEKYVSKDDTVSDDLKEHLNRKPVFLPRNVRQWRLQQKKSRSDAAETEELPGSPKQSTEEMDILDNTECKFNVNSFKIVYVVNSEYYLYKRTALTKARESHKRVSLKLHDKFTTWIENWRQENLTDDQREAATEWLMGRTADLVACTTTTESCGGPDATPYFSYNKYRVEYEYESKSEAGDPDTAKEATS
uniref:Paired amphipathic helix protein Sin3a n=1 Tax=Crassostrea virginica TaxID=6565 RepID=A0A8B8BVC2_CRAVI|nr:paired amphipathic helix protein Sin3a-like isoform X1 [Crassostrea virginica]XP_022306847.1 paired amphipathic helix protein Sin3a-like isoform X1 [Crassostrea virginica]